jgi:hypothetical protein
MLPKQLLHLSVIKAQWGNNHDHGLDNYTCFTAATWRQALSVKSLDKNGAQSAL